MGSSKSTLENLDLVLGNVEQTFWINKRVFLTGNTGFKGSWLSIWLQSMGAIVKGYSLSAPTNPSLFEVAKISKHIETDFGDIRDLKELKKSMQSFSPDILIHMAAQPLVKFSYENPIDTYSTNVMGTANVLEAARYCSNLKSIVSVTTDKCYENKEWIWGYREDEPMGGYDPYSSSKGCAELVTSAYRRSFFNSSDSASIASARAGNVIGGGDWASNRLIPDILRSFEKSEPVIIRNPLSTRPWQHVLEPLSGYLVLAQNLYEFGADYAEPFNFGPKDEDCCTVKYILEQMTTLWGPGASWKLDSNQNPHEAQFLKLDCSKANFKLNWYPRWNVSIALKQIVDWHLNWKSGYDMYEKCLNEISNYQNS
jgi:CDP-glucose 4,6-dehydratase